jgi:hypothetical protein
MVIDSEDDSRETLTNIALLQPPPHHGRVIITLAPDFKPSAMSATNTDRQASFEDWPWNQKRLKMESEKKAYQMKEAKKKEQLIMLRMPQTKQEDSRGRKTWLESDNVGIVHW